MSSGLLKLIRFAYLPNATFGRLIFPTGRSYFTVECPWLHNAAGKSCIPEGNYQLGLRMSEVVRRTTRGMFTKGWEIQDVPGRTYIMFHVGNWASDVEGCVAVGQTFGAMPKGPHQLGVGNSRIAYNEFMAIMATRKNWSLDISVQRATV